MRPSTTVLAVAGAALIAAAFFFWTFPLDLLLGRPGYWNNPGDDPAQALNGYLAFAHDSWRLPLFRTELMNPPGGANIIFTDPIPLLALFGKIVYRASGHLINYFGPWLLLCYVMQAVVGVLLARQLNIRSFTWQFAAGVIFLFTPAFIFRFSHRPLAGHFLILLAIVLYLRLIKLPSVAVRAAFSGMFVTMFLVNAYMLAMVGAIYLASLTEAHRRGTLSPRQAGATLVVTLAGLVLLVVLCGGSQLWSAVGIIDGFGFYSMNLASPVWPQLSGIFPWGRRLIDSTGGQYEGFNYLGLGVLGLVLIAVFAAWGKPMLRLRRRHFFLMLLTTVMALYALSLDIWIGPVQLTHFDASKIPVFRSIAGTFRSSGRFFWPLGYVMVAGAIAVVARTLPRRPAPAFLVAIALVQAVDAVGVRSEVLDRLQHRIPPLPLDRALWGGIVHRHRAVIIEPHFICVAPDAREVHREILLLAAEAAVPANSAIVNRLNVDCDKERDQVALDPFAEPYGTPALHLFMAGTISTALLVSTKPEGMICAEASFGVVCSNAEQPGFAPGQPGFTSLTTEPYVVGTVQDLSTRSNGNGFLGPGWSAAEAWGRWAVGERSQILLPLASAPQHDLMFTADIHVFADNTGYAVRKAAIWVNGRHLTDLTVPDTADRQISFAIPRASAAARPVLAVELVFDHPKSPAELRLSGDERRLTWGFRQFVVTEIQ